MRRSRLSAPLVYWQLSSGSRTARLPIGVGGGMDAAEFLSLEFRANDRLLWRVDLQGEEIRAAQKRMHHEMRSQAAQLGVANFDGLVQALATSLGWSADQARSLAIVFVFPGPYALERVGARWNVPKRRGRPTSVARAVRVRKLALAWIELTSKRAGISHSHFLDAFVAAAPFLGLYSMRGRALADAEKFLRQEQRKLRAGCFQWVRPPLQGTQGDLQLTTPSVLLPSTDDN